MRVSEDKAEVHCQQMLAVFLFLLPCLLFLRVSMLCLTASFQQPAWNIALLRPALLKHFLPSILLLIELIWLITSVANC